MDQLSFQQGARLSHNLFLYSERQNLPQEAKFPGKEQPQFHIFFPDLTITLLNEEDFKKSIMRPNKKKTKQVCFPQQAHFIFLPQITAFTIFIWTFSKLKSNYLF